jgi:phosphatidylglycerophosphate synthase
MNCRRSAAAILLTLWGVLALAAWTLDWAGFGLALALYAAVAAIVLARLPAQPRFGAANAVTAARAAATCLLFGLWAAATSFDPALLWTLAAIASAALAADGIDGWLARRTGSESRFGARFDMETDAASVLALALLVHAAGRAGAFVLLSGALRYLSVAAGWVVPALARPLTPSLRRKAICVAQVGLLIAALAPPVPAGLAQGLAALGLMLLVYSFAADGVALLSAARGSPILSQQHARRLSP